MAATGLLALGGCGGGAEDDAREVQEVVRDFAEARSKSDGKAFCSLVTREFRERITGATGENAGAQCVRQIDASQGTPIEVVKVGAPKVTGDRATVTAELDFAGQRQNRLLKLHREDGRFRLAQE